MIDMAPQEEREEREESSAKVVRSLEESSYSRLILVFRPEVPVRAPRSDPLETGDE